MQRIPDSQLKAVKDLYYKNELSMREIGERLTVSIDAVTYFMRKHKLKRRNFFETNKLLFAKKEPSFKARQIKSSQGKELKAIGAMLYWGEGYKSDKSGGVDFANSDPEMISMFLRFLRDCYELDEKRFRIYLYCYTDQNVNELISFWSDLSKISKEQFLKPYVRKDFDSNGRKMKYGLIHIRYSDKKLLWEIKKSINFYKNKFLK